MVRRDKSGSEAETGWKQRRNRYGLHTGSSGSAREHDWVVGLQILTRHPVQFSLGCCSWVNGIIRRFWEAALVSSGNRWDLIGNSV